MICAGLDSGARTIKAVLFDAAAGRILARGVADQGPDQEARLARLYDRVLNEAGLARAGVTRVVATGYARHHTALADATLTEILCHARGVRHLVPDARALVEIGGQDSKVIRLHADGTLHDFAMNDRCAAGTGRFLEMTAARLQTPLAGFGQLAARSTRPAAITSTCAVFAENEITGLLAAGAAPADLAAGVLAAIAQRIAVLAGSRLPEPVILTGGAALVPGLAEALAQALQRPVRVAPEPQLTGALGAALSTAP